MNTTRVKFGTEGRKKLADGINKLADAVVATLGPNGRNALFNNGLHSVFSTKDGVTVAKRFELEDPVEQLGVMMIKQAAEQTQNKAGDGTTTSTLLAREIITNGLKHLSNGENAVKIKRSIDTAVKNVISELKDNLSEDVSESEQINQIAKLSANNDEEVGRLISTALENVGSDGIVHIEESKTGETYLENVEGLQFDKGYKSPYFVTDNESMTSILDNPLILVSEAKLSNNVKSFLPIFEAVSSQGRSLLIIANDIEHESLATLLVNKMKGTLNVCAVQSPEWGDQRKLALQDIGIMTGAKVFSPEKGMKWEQFSLDWLGSCRSATITKGTTTIVDGKGDVEEIKKQIKSIQNSIEKETLPYAKQKFQQRLAKLSGGVSIIHVGGNTTTEVKEKKDRVQDSLYATKAAIKEGIVPGGGVALLRARQVLDRSSDIGTQLVYDACAKPFIQILTNAGYTSEEAAVLGKHKIAEDSNDKWSGYDIETDKVVNFKETGIIDPLKITRTALESAASSAGTLLLTETVIYNKEVNPEEIDI